MKVEYINPFLKASIEVLKMMAQMDFATGKPFLKTSPFTAENMIIVVGITGEIRGQAVITMSTEMAKTIASNMMMGMPVPELDEMAKSALSELGNMIMGNSATLLFNKGVNIDITPPTLMMGENMQISSGQMTTISVPLVSDAGTISMDVSIKE